MKILNGDGAEIGPLEEPAIAMLISEGAITADAYVLRPEAGLLPITQVEAFAAALICIDGHPLAKKLIAEETLETSFAGWLAQLFRDATTGTLEVESGGESTKIYVLEGMPMFAEGGALEDTLGRLLIRSGRLTEEQVDSAIEHYLEHHDTYKRIGEVLIELGMCTTEEISTALHQQTLEKVVRCFGLTNPQCRLVKDDAVKRMPRFACSTRSLLEEGIARHYSGDRLERLIESVSNEMGHAIASDELVPALLGDLEERTPPPDDDEDGALADAFEDRV